MVKLFKKLFLAYQQSMWYAAQAKGEYAKIGSFIQETLQILTLLAVKGINPPFWVVVLCYILIFIIAVRIGVGLVSIGVVRYNSEFAAKHTPGADAYNEDSATAEILRQLKDINSKLDKHD